MNSELRYYLTVFARRLPIFLLVALSISSSAVAVALILPTVFTANASLLVEEPAIPDELAASTVSVDATQQLEVIQRRLTTRANLIEIARKYQVYEDIGVLNPDQIVARMRNDTNIRSRSGRRTATVLVVEFSARTGEIAASVTNEYVTRILDDNARQRVRQAEDTLAFFEQEVERLETELDLQSARILKFQNENSEALPDSLNFRMARASQLQERLSQMARERASLEDQRSRLVTLFDRTGGVPLGEAASFEEQRLQGLRQRLTEARAIYSEESPQVRLLRSQVSALEAQIAQNASATLGGGESGSGSGGGEPPSPQATVLDLQLSEIDSQLEFLENDQKNAEAELAKLEETIRKTPNNSIALEALQRDYQNVQDQYNRAVERLSRAVTGERIESLSKGERITVIEQAVAPKEPSAPNRKFIAVAGTALGLGSASFLVVLLEMLNRSIRRPVDLTRGLGISPIATIPYISSRGEKTRRRVLIFFSLFLVLAGIPAALYLFHYTVMPLDLLVDRIIDGLPL